jgi:hypothetical protein
MVTQNAYLKFLGQLVHEHFNSIKQTGITSLRIHNSL